MNNKGQVGFGIVIAIFIFVIGFGVLNIIKPEVTTARGVDGLNCINATNITDGTKLTCLAVDLTIPLIVLGLFALFSGVVIARLIGLGVRRR